MFGGGVPTKNDVIIGDLLTAISEAIIQLPTINFFFHRRKRGYISKRMVREESEVKWN